MSRRSMTRAGAAALMGVVAILTTATAAPPAAGRSAPSGTVRGHFRQVGGPAPGAAQPLRGHIYLRSHGHRVATFHVHKHGRFHGSVAPGRYHVLGRPRYDTGRYRCRAAHPIHVRPGQVVRINVTCQVP